MTGGSPKSPRKNAPRHDPIGRTAELAEKRQRRSFRLKLLFFLGALLMILLIASYQFWLRDSALVEFKNLEIVGVSTETKEGQQIDQAVRTAMGEMTTLNVDPALLEGELARFPRIRSSEIDASFPSSGKVTLVLRENGSILGEGSDALLISTDGYVLGPAAGQESALPFIGSEVEGETDVAGEVLSGSAMNQALVLGAAPPELRPHVKQSKATQLGVEVVFKNGLTMLFGDPGQSDQKWRAAASLIADPTFDTSSYVDLTVPRRPGISTPGSEGSLPEEGQEEVPEDPAVG